MLDVNDEMVKIREKMARLMREFNSVHPQIAVMISDVRKAYLDRGNSYSLVIFVPAHRFEGADNGMFLGHEVRTHSGNHIYIGIET